MCRSPTPIVILTEVDVEYCFFTPQCLLTLFVQDTRGTHDLAVHADGAYGELRGVLNILISTGMYFRFIQFKVHVIICCSTAEYYIRIFVHTPLYTVLLSFRLFPLQRHGAKSLKDRFYSCGNVTCQSCQRDS